MNTVMNHQVPLKQEKLCTMKLANANNLNQYGGKKEDNLFRRCQICDGCV